MIGHERASKVGSQGRARLKTGSSRPTDDCHAAFKLCLCSQRPSTNDTDEKVGKLASTLTFDIAKRWKIWQLQVRHRKQLDDY